MSTEETTQQSEAPEQPSGSAPAGPDSKDLEAFIDQLATRENQVHQMEMTVKQREAELAELLEVKKLIGTDPKTALTKLGLMKQDFISDLLQPEKPDFVKQLTERMDQFQQYMDSVKQRESYQARAMQHQNAVDAVEKSIDPEKYPHAAWYVGRRKGTIGNNVVQMMTEAEKRGQRLSLDKVLAEVEKELADDLEDHAKVRAERSKNVLPSDGKKPKTLSTSAASSVSATSGRAKPTTYKELMAETEAEVQQMIRVLENGRGK